MSSTTTMEDKDKDESSTPDVPKSTSGKGKNQKARHKKNNKGEKTVNVVSLYTSSTKELKLHIFTTKSTMNKTFLLSREKLLGYATTKFGNHVLMFSLLSERRVALIHTPTPTPINHTRALVFELRQNEIEAKQFRAEFRKLRNDIGKLCGVLWDQCDSGMKNKTQSDPEYVNISKMLNVIRLLTIIERICLSNDSSKYYALQGFIAQKILLNFRQVNGMSLVDYHREFEMLGKVALEARAYFVTMD